MSNIFPNNLTPKMVEGIKGFNLCSFLIGLEGWRRGLNLKYYVDINQYSPIYVKVKSALGRSFSLSDGNKVHYFMQSRGDYVENESVFIANNKQRTKKLLEKNNIPVLPSIDFNKSISNGEIIEKITDIGYPLIIKPTNGRLSKGVVLNIKNNNELYDALLQVRNKMGYKEIIIEKYFQGEDIRLCVVGDKAIAALRRIPANVTGDGESSISELIKRKNKSRSNNPYLADRLIKIDKETFNVLKTQDYQIHDVLENGKTILVKNKSTMTQGVDLFDITDTIPEDVKNIAVNAVKSIHGMTHGSVDMLYDGKTAYVLEVNATANISMHMFPTEGEPRNVPAYLIDYYFPNSIDNRMNNQNMYFDYLDIVSTLKKNYTNYIDVKQLNYEKYTSKKIIIKGNNLNKRYRLLVRKNAMKYDIKGYLVKTSNSSIEIICASNSEGNLEKFKNICKKGTRKGKDIIKEFKEYDWSDEVNVGFRVLDL